MSVRTTSRSSRALSAPVDTHFFVQYDSIIRCPTEYTLAGRVTWRRGSISSSPNKKFWRGRDVRSWMCLTPFKRKHLNINCGRAYFAPRKPQTPTNRWKTTLKPFNCPWRPKEKKSVTWRLLAICLCPRRFSWFVCATLAGHAWLMSTPLPHPMFYHILTWAAYMLAAHTYSLGRSSLERQIIPRKVGADRWSGSWIKTGHT